LSVFRAVHNFGAMFEDWKKAWREAVENFRRELQDSETSGGNVTAQVRAMRRDIASVRGALGKLDAEIGRTRNDATKERDAEQVARRREGLARNVGDEETVRIAGEYATRHARRAAIFERKVEVLAAERELLASDLDSMEQVLAAHPEAQSIAEGAPDVLEERKRTDQDFGRLEREAREKAAAARLEELKRRMK
jgi:hypothetical protein